MRHARRWDLPKGHLEPGESDLECALRETGEETGLGPDSFTVHPEFRFETQYEVRESRFGGGAARKTLVIFLAVALRDVSIRVTEHLDAVWFPWSPPQQIQPMTIDPLLKHLESFLDDPMQYAWVLAHSGPA